MSVHSNVCVCIATLSAKFVTKGLVPCMHATLYHTSCTVTACIRIRFKKNSGRNRY